MRRVIAGICCYIMLFSVISVQAEEGNLEVLQEAIECGNQEEQEGQTVYDTLNLPKKSARIP